MSGQTLGLSFTDRRRDVWNEPLEYPGFTLTVTGSGFLPSSVVQFNGQVKATTYVSFTELRAEIPASDIAQNGVFVVNVVNASSAPSEPSQDGGSGTSSNPGLIKSTSPLPFITAISPASVPVGSPGVTLTIEGRGFVKDTSYILWNGNERLATHVNSTKITVDVPASDFSSEGTISFSALNPPPGGGKSNSQAFTITPKLAILSELYYPRLVSSGGDATTGKGSEVTGIALVNNSASDARLVLRASNRSALYAVSLIAFTMFLRSVLWIATMGLSLIWFRGTLAGVFANRASRRASRA